MKLLSELKKKGKKEISEYLVKKEIIKCEMNKERSFIDQSRVF